MVTLCVQGRQRLFGEITLEGMNLSPIGRMISEIWQSLPEHYPGIELDTFVVMPDHLHGIIWLTRREDSREGQPRYTIEGQPQDTIEGQPRGVAPTDTKNVGATFCGCPPGVDATSPRGCPPGVDSASPYGCPLGVEPTCSPVMATTREDLSLSDVVHRYKLTTTNRYFEGVRELGWPRVDRRLWQRNFYEQIIRSEDALDQMRTYVAKNPSRWQAALR